MQALRFQRTTSSRSISSRRPRFLGRLLLVAGVLIVTVLASASVSAQTVPAATHSIQIAGLNMIDEQHGWAYDENTTHVYTTRQGPEHWHEVTPSQLSSAANTIVTSSLFLDARHGYLGVLQNGTQILLLSTQDSGQNWQSTAFAFPTANRAFFLRQILFLDAQHGWLSFNAAGRLPGTADLMLMRTSDGGKTWKTLINTLEHPESIPLPYGQTINFAFANLQQGWATGGWPAGDVYLVRTQDGGKTWSKANIAPIKGGDGNNYTQGYGPFWQNQHTGTLFVRFNAPDTALPHLTTYQTRDGGKTWLLGPSTPSTSFQEVNLLSFLNAREGWSFGFDGLGQYILHHTNNGGRIWELLHPRGLFKADASGQVLGNLSFLASQKGWVCIKDAQNNWHIFQTESGGKSWHALQTTAD